MAGTGPAGNVLLHIGPDVPFGYQTMRGLDARMRQRVQVVKDFSTHRKSHQRTARGQPWEISQRRVRLDFESGTCATCNEIGELESLRSSSSCAEARMSRSIGDCFRARTLQDSASAVQLA